MRHFIVFILSLLSAVSVSAQTQELYIKHSSGLVLTYDATKDKGVIVKSTSALVRPLTLKENADGTCAIAYRDDDGTERYLALSGNWNTTFQTNAGAAEARFIIEPAGKGELLRIKCQKNGRFLGTDSTNDGSSVFADKDGNSTNHYWYLAETPDQKVKAMDASYFIFPATRLQKNEGWGVSLCWWANMCGKWSDKNIDKIIDWLVSPTGLNYNIFRYNIGGGDDPENRNCTLHHMGKGKGLRAEMEGFKDSTEDVYHWDRDAAQRKIMLKIKEKRPDAIFEAFSNSAPYYMTYSGCVAGAVNGGDDNLRPEYYEEFAHYLVDVCKHYKDEYGIEFKTLEPFNEPNTTFWYCSGVQEGCHFDYKSQIAFLKVLAPILAESGLSTIIAAADETNVGTAVGGFKEYEKAGIQNLVGQWNTHTYVASNPARSQFGSLARSAGKQLWMSEVGSGGSGIGGNLSLMQRLMDDVRYILPTAWIDWQYVEENGDQWCTVRGSFANQTYERVKSYYVHQHLTRFIPVGYSFVPSTNHSTLAAISAQADTLVLVALNNDANEVHHVAHLLSAEPDVSRIRGYITTANKNLSAFRPTTLQADSLCFDLPAQSIATFIIPLTSVEEHPREVEPDVPYLILPQYNVDAALTTNASGALVLGGITLDSTQVWTFHPKGNQWELTNAAGRSVIVGSSYALQTSSARASRLSVLPVEDFYWRIMTDATKAFDLENEGYTTGTKVGQYAYGNSASACHRHWQLLRLPDAANPSDGLHDLLSTSSSVARVIATYNLQGVPVPANTRGLLIQRMSDGTSRKVLVE